MADTPELPIVTCADQAAWEAWLEANNAQAGAWLKFAKKSSPHRTVTYAEAVEGALCYGWIDGQARSLDEHFYLQRFTPRRKRSKWSQSNVEKATRLIEAGRMRASGLAQVEAAKADGRWDEAYPPSSEAKPSPDFQQALDANPDAAAFFASLSGMNRYAFLYRLHQVKDPARRADRIADYITRLSHGRTLD